MKKLGILIAVFGLFALVGVASASTADVLQPAQTITYNEEVVINDTLRVDSAYIGSTEAGVGGVTFFNGTMINNSIDTDGESTVPLTLGDDVRIDGELYRTEVGGENPIKLADTIRPQTTSTYDLGTEDNQFRSAYFGGVVYAAAYSGEGTISSTDIADDSILTGDIADNTITGDDISPTSTITTMGLTTSGDINQVIGFGAARALIDIDSSVDPAADCMSKYWTGDDSVVTCTKTSTGVYALAFDSDMGMTNRYFSATTQTPDRMVSATVVGDNVGIVAMDDLGVVGDADVMFVVY